MVNWSRPVCFVNARVVVPGGIAASLRFTSNVLDIDAPPRDDDAVVDLEGAFVLPGLINAHDHLELNHYGPLKRHDSYENASDWIADLQPVLKEDAAVRRNMAYPLKARLFIGGLKNVLSGVTTVAHHNPHYREMGRWFPVRVLRRFGWAHSFELEGRAVGARGEPGGNVRDEYRATPADQPFIVHLGEGVDGRAASELSRLDALGCLRENTVLVHGVAITASDWCRVMAKKASLVWCPASNRFLFGATVPVQQFYQTCPDSRAHVCLGTDSRLTGARDLLDELRIAKETSGLDAHALLQAVTTTPARVLRLAAGGCIAAGAPADLMVLPALADDPAEALLAATRRDVSLVTIGGRPVVGALKFRPIWVARRAAARPIFVDGASRLAESRLGWAIARSPIREPGVDCP